MRFEEQGLVDRDFWVEAGKAGVIGIETPAELGGWGKDFSRLLSSQPDGASKRQCFI